VQRGDGRIVALEIKLARAVEDTTLAHLRWLRDRLGQHAGGYERGGGLEVAGDAVDQAGRQADYGDAVVGHGGGLVGEDLAAGGQGMRELGDGGAQVLYVVFAQPDLDGLGLQWWRHPGKAC